MPDRLRGLPEPDTLRGATTWHASVARRADSASVGVTIMNVRPIHDRLIVERLEDPAQAPGSIIVPDSAKEKPQRGKVLAAGLGKINKEGLRVPLDIKAGDIVVFGKYSGQEIKLEGVEYLIMKEDDVLAIANGSDAGSI
jgi:chaperonin GroES